MAEDDKKQSATAKRAERKAQDETPRQGLKLIGNANAGGSEGLKTRSLIEMVATETGGKKPDVKKIVEATLAALGKALATGQQLNVPPLGKIKVARDNGIALTLKLRLADEAKAAGLALADEEEDS
ncbi:MAG TPA: HU family DNA-binding protein [Tabrizicola sp.]|nr:HU family DNA-binding protein [Tabrizicola sp.]